MGWIDEQNPTNDRMSAIAKRNALAEIEYQTVDEEDIPD